MNTLSKHPIIVSMTLVVSVCALLTGCPWDKEPGDITGWVSDAQGNLLPLVKVSLSNGASTHTDSHGLFIFKGLEPEKQYTVSFSLEGYAPASQQIEVLEEAVVSLEQRLVAQAEGQALSGDSGVVTDASGNSLTIPEDALGGSAKNGGSVNVHISGINFETEAALEMLPGSFNVAIDGQSNWGQFEATSTVYFNITEDGEAVVLEAGRSVTITMLLPEDTTYVVGDTVALWRFETASGLWVNGPEGTVVEGEDGLLYVTASVEHLGWWSCGSVQEASHTFSGTVYDENNEKLPGALVRAVGLDYHGLSYARSDEDGNYEVMVKPESQLRLELIPAGAFYVINQSELTAGAANESTTFNMAIDYISCIAGYLTNESGAPMEGEQVLSSGGGSAVTDAEGYFCLGAPGGVYVAVYTPGRPPRVVLTPETAECGDEDLELITLAITYPEDGDIVGRVFHNLTTVGETPIHSATALFCSGFDGEEYAAYRDQSPEEDSFSLYTKYYDLDIQSSLGLDNWFEASFTSEGDATGLLADMNFAFNGVFDANVSASEGGTVPENTEELEFGRVGGLDAGDTASLTNGLTTLPMPSLNQYLGNRNGQFGALGCYGQDPFFVEDDFINGDTISFSWPGGLDLGAFSLDSTVPEALVLSSPSVADLQKAFEPAEEGGVIPDLNLSWEVTNPGSYVTLILETVALNTFTELGLLSQFHYKIEFGALVCRLVDDGECTIPGEQLAQLVNLVPEDEKSLVISTSTRVNFLLGLRSNVSENDSVPLLRGEAGNGRVLAFATSDPVILWNVNFDAAVSWE